MAKTVTVKMAELVLDWNLYPRHEVDGFQVARLTEAIEAGEQLPPMMVDEKSLRIVDGFHRHHAYTRAKVEDVVVEVRQFRSDAEIFMQAVALNARHGVPLAPQDQARVLLLGERLHITREKLADALAIRPARIEKIERKLGRIRRGGAFYLKPAIRHYSGREVPKAVVDISEGLGGNTAEFYIRQLLMLLHSGGLNITEEVDGLLNELAEAISALKVAA